MRKEFFEEKFSARKLYAGGSAPEIPGPEMPEHFDDDHRRVWIKTTTLLKKWGMLKEIDGAVVEAYCTSYLLWVSSDKEIKKLTDAAIKDKKSKIHGLLIRGATSTLIVNPLITISNKARADTIYYAAQLGMTPAARLRIEASAGNIVAKKVNVFARLKEYAN